MNLVSPHVFAPGARNKSLNFWVAMSGSMKLRRARQLFFDKFPILTIKITQVVA